MRRLALCWLLGFACFAYAQQQQNPGDVYESGVTPETPAQAVQKLYTLAAKITEDPSSGYDAQTDHWPEADAAWQQWDNAMGLNGNALTQQQRQELVPCAAHLGAAIDTAERSYRIQISQPNNSAAQADAQKLLGIARSDFKQCNPADALNGSNGNPATGANSPGSQTGGVSGGGSNPPIQGGVNTGPDGTPGTTSGGGPGAPQTPGTQSGTPPGTTPQGTPPGTKGLSRTPVPTKPAPNPGTPTTSAPPNMGAIDKAMSNCLSKKLPYFAQQGVQPTFMEEAMYTAPPSAKSKPFAQLPGESQIFLEETAMAMQALSEHDSKYPRNPDYTAGKAQDDIVGYLDHCLTQAGLMPEGDDGTPEEPRYQYARFLGVGIGDPRIAIFESGYNLSLVPAPLLPRTDPGIIP